MESRDVYGKATSNRKFNAGKIQGDFRCNTECLKIDNSTITDIDDELNESRKVDEAAYESFLLLILTELEGAGAKTKEK